MKALELAFVQKMDMSSNQLTPGNYAKLVKRAGYAAAATATILIIAKLFAWFYTGSAAMLSSVTDSMMDLAATAVNVLAIRFALMPADREHQFGHGKAESLAGLAQAAFILGTSLLLLFHGADRLINPVELNKPSIAIWVSFFAIILTGVLLSYQHLVVKKTGSLVIKADALHYRSDLLLNASVLVAIVLTLFGYWWADGLFAMLVAVWIAKSAIDIALEASNQLLDHRLPEQEIQQIEQAIQNDDNILALTQLRTRQAGMTRFVEFTVQLNAELSLQQAHDIADNAESRVTKLYERAETICHFEPKKH